MCLFIYNSNAILTCLTHFIFQCLRFFCDRNRKFRHLFRVLFPCSKFYLCHKCCPFVIFYPISENLVCETGSLTLWENFRLSVFENRNLRRIFGPKRDENGEWRRLDSHSLYCSTNIIKEIKYRRLSWQSIHLCLRTSGPEASSGLLILELLLISF